MTHTPKPEPKLADGDAWSASAEAEDEAPKVGRHYPCEQCGAKLRYAIGSTELQCLYCGHEQHIDEVCSDRLREYPLDEALQALAKATREAEQAAPTSSASGESALSCQKCGAHFRWQGAKQAGECPFCGSNVLLDAKALKPLEPHGVLPFGVDARAAKQAYRVWLKGLWFAPNGLKKYARAEHSLHGIYLPFWTYDSQTSTRYNGRRGTVYYETRYVYVNRNGRQERVSQQVPKVRWRRVSGQVQRFFDDVLIGASKTLPRAIVDRLKPWRLDQLQAYDERFLSGFGSEYYQVELDEGFSLAQEQMAGQIRRDIARDIGGDRQEIHQMQTTHRDTHFKYVLLPVWTAAFSFSGKSYRFVVNAQSGKVAGERPYSWVKIGLAALLALAVLGSGAWLVAEQQYALQYAPVDSRNWTF